MKTISRCCLLAMLCALTSLRAEDAPGEYKIIHKEVLGGDGSWDYLSLDSAARRLYIARETHVMIVDMDSYKVVGELTNTNGVHGAAVVPEFERIFTSNGRGNTVSIFNLKTLATVGDVKAGPKPDAIVYDPASKRVFAFNNGGITTTAIDAQSGQVSGEIDLGGAPEFAVSDGKGHMYVNLEDKSEVVDFDSAKLTVLHRWPLAPGTTPTGLAIDIEHRRLFSGCRGSKTMQVLDADTGKTVASLPIGAGVDAAAFDPGTQNAFSSNGDGTLTVIHEDAPTEFRVAQNVVTMPGARTMALDPKTHEIWMVTAETQAPEPGQRRGKQVPGTFTVLTLGISK